MRPLLYKELLSAWPQLIAILVIGGMLVVGDLLATDSLRGLAMLLAGSTEGLLLVTGGLAFALGHGQIGPEVAHGHVELLDALPVGRRHVYAAKLIAGLGSLLVLVAVAALGKLAMSQLTWGDFAFTTLITAFGALAAGLIAFYSTGLVLSWFGSFGWALLGVALSILTTAAELSEAIRPLSILHGYGAVRFEANLPVVVLWPVAFWSVYAVVCIIVSGGLFVGRGDRIVQAGSRVAAVVRSFAIVLIAGLLVLMATVSSARLALRGRPSEEAAVLHQVGTYRVLIPRQAQAEGMELIARLPAIDDAVRGLLGIEAPLTLDIEIGGRGRFHAGRYTGGKIRMSLDGNPAHTLAHELTHAYADRMSAGGLHAHHNAMRFFNEGLAVWVADYALERLELSDPMRAWAGALYTMGHQPLDLLMNDQARSERYDAFEAYPLGLVFVEAVVDTGTNQALACICAVAGELPTTPVAGVALWGRLTSACDVSMAAIAEAYDQRLDAYAYRWPLPEGEWVGQPARFEDGLHVVVPPSKDVVQRCRFRSRLNAAPADLDEVDVVEGRCPVYAIIGSTNTISYQVGIRLATGWTAYGPWIEQPIPKPLPEVKGTTTRR